MTDRRRAMAEDMRRQVLAVLADGPRAFAEILEAVELPKGKDAHFLNNVIQSLKLRGLVTYALTTKQWTRAVGVEVPAPIDQGDADDAAPLADLDDAELPADLDGSSSKGAGIDLEPGDPPELAAVAPVLEQAASTPVPIYSDLVTGELDPTAIEIRVHLHLDAAAFDRLGDSAGEVLHAAGVLLRARREFDA